MSFAEQPTLLNVRKLKKKKSKVITFWENNKKEILYLTFSDLYLVTCHSKMDQSAGQL